MCRLRLVSTGEMAQATRSIQAGPRSAVAAGWAALLLLPLAGFWILISAPSADVRWEHHPAHFWLVLGAALLSAVLAYATGGGARPPGGARPFLWFPGFLGPGGVP